MRENMQLKGVMSSSMEKVRSIHEGDESLSAKNDVTSYYSKSSKFKPCLTLEMFKVPEYQLSKEMKQKFKDLAKIYKKIDD